MRGISKLAVLTCILAGSASAAPQIDKTYIRSLAAPGKSVLVIEYYGADGKVAERKGYASEAGFSANDDLGIQVNSKTSVKLWGIEPCKGDFVNRKEDFAGSCNDYAKEQLQIMLKAPSVLYCRAFISEKNAASQNATCFGYYNYPNALDTVDMLEEQLLSIGAVRLNRKKNGEAERADLTDAEQIGKDGSYGFWADEREVAQ
ncbi:hypothetical protein KHQ08_18180 (plasmid) [Pseudochrobactrum algeriensis]|uniref:Thermonuclease family protein n=1 Tax=Pseudochrobactrum kiredjianiae TaxID=386305 RepID=A0ABW3UZ25_9HYPH|nr:MULTISPECIES: hypothetical protein [Pseudochrobactrum]MDM7852983.1 hypothetical protein [Pseudochrobactrum kiredjianiae]MDP8250916.1 hypothetical protein [Pseudochrobactrum saccharolyticum]QVQ38633.1 hypothetical protein KHQ08_18180 [Pseudochrobactrum algeriensis]QVQ45777.1 hypothetical protein KHQ09_18080 [Pseudochrobactrum algeriensis]